MELSFRPTLDRDEAHRRLERLLVSGPLDDPGLLRRIARLADDFGRYAASYPLPLWAPGLILTSDMRSLTEVQLPMSRVNAVLVRLLHLSCRFAPQLGGTCLPRCAGWLDFLQRHRPQPDRADPAHLLRTLADDPEERARFIFGLLLPHHFGGGFDRYPEQARWIARWLLGNIERLGGRIRALDSACGSGEGTYQLGELLVAAGYRGPRSVLHGSTLEQVELFAAAHAWFPHDPRREAQYRDRIAPLMRGEHGIALEFYLDEVGSAGAGSPGGTRTGYDLVLCNGLLAGPLLHEPAQLEGAIGALAARLAPGGVLLAADRFHEGWRLRIPKGKLQDLLRRHGLEPVEVPEGIGGAWPGSG